MVKNNKILVSLTAAALATCFLTGNKEAKADENRGEAGPKQALVKEIAAANKEVEKREDLLQQKMQRTLLLSNKVANAQDEAKTTDSAQKQLAQLDEQIKDYEQKYQAEEDKQKSIEQEINQAQKDKDQVKKELVQKQDNLKALKEETEKARAQLAQALKESKEKAGKDDSGANKDYEQLVANQQKLLSKLKSLSEEADKLKAELSDKGKALLALTEPIQKAETESKKAQEAFDLFTRYDKSAKHVLETSEKATKDFREQLEQAQAKYDQLKASHADAQTLKAQEQKVSSIKIQYDNQIKQEENSRQKLEETRKNLAERTEIFNQASQKQNGLLDQQHELQQSQEQLTQTLSQNKKEHEQTLENLVAEVQNMLDAQVNPPSRADADLQEVEQAYINFSSKTAAQEELSQTISQLQQFLAQKNQEMTHLKNEAGQFQQNKNNFLLKIQELLKEKLAAFKDLPVKEDKPRPADDEQALKKKIEALEAEIAAVKKELNGAKTQFAALRQNDGLEQKREALYQEIIRQYQQILTQKMNQTKITPKSHSKKPQRKKIYLKVKIKGHWQKLTYKAAMAKLKKNQSLSVSFKTTVKSKRAKLTYKNGHMSRKINKGKKVTLSEARKSKGQILFRLAKTRLWINAKDLQIS